VIGYFSGFGKIIKRFKEGYASFAKDLEFFCGKVDVVKGKCEAIVFIAHNTNISFFIYCILLE
jgi:hypothetical protein